MILRLNPFLLRVTMCFFAPPDDGGGAGGGAAVAEPPATGAPDGDADVLNFQMPDMGAALKEITGKDVTPTPAPAKPPEKKDPPVVEKPAVEKKPEPVKDPPAKQLRAELDSIKAERDELKKKLEAGDPRLVEAQNAVKAKEEEVADARKKLTEYEQQTIRQSDAVREPLRKLDEAYGRDATKFFRSVTEIDQSTLNSLVRTYAALPFGKPEYKEARAEFETKLNETLGGTEEREARKLGATLDFIERSWDWANERAQTEKEVNGKAAKIYSDAQTADYGKKRDFVRTNIEHAKAIPEDMEKTDPWHIKVLLDKFSKTMGDKLPEFEKNIPEFVEQLFAGQAPRSEEDYAGMTPQQVEESRAAEAERHEKIRSTGIEITYNGLRAMRLFPALWKEYQRLAEKVKEKTDGDPPDPTRGTDGEPSADDDLRNFKPPAIPNF
jgi:hypothetical protein